MRKFLIAGVFTGLVACSTPGSDVILSLDENVQADALRACHADLGITGPFVPQKIPLKNGQTSVFVSNGNGVSLAEARSVNRCASERLLATYGTGSDVMSSGAKEQEAAILACKKERGVPGPYTTNVFSYGSRATEVQIIPSHSVTKTDARAINACARAKLRGASTASSRPTVTADQYKPAPAPRVTNRPVAGGGICPKHAPTLYGGTTYCIGN